MKPIKRITLSLAFLAVSVFAVGHGYALFSDLVVAKDNTFYSGTYDIQISMTDADGNSIGDGASGTWLDSVSSVWSTPQQWTPGKSKGSRVFIRNRGDVDAEQLLWTLTQRSFTGTKQLDEVINLIDAWYDHNANGIEDAGDDISGALDVAYNSNGGSLTMKELFDGTNGATGGTAFDLESGSTVLPSGATNSTIGGATGNGKSLVLIWQFDPNADASYQNSQVELDFEFTGVQKVN